ncbi:MAG: DsbA family protein [Candidatus Kerfeldbacteria bacterium]|nr:DsbA family protein [Candidatus Kerfeldbacteria bacterium]
MTEQHHEGGRSSFFSGMAPKASFLFGILTGIAAMSLIGFVLTVTVLFNDGGRTAVAIDDSGTVAGATAPQPTAPAEPEGNPDALRPVDDNDHVLGPKNAKVTVIEFSDFQCPFCQRVHPTLQQVMKEYEGKVRWVYRHFPLESIHPQARPSANAAECIADLGGNDAFWAFADDAYANQSSLGDDYFLTVAKKAGLNEKKFQDCYTAKKFDALVQKDISEGEAAGVQGTPATFVNGKLISGALPYESFKTAIDQALGS